MKLTGQDKYLVMYLKLSNIRRKSGVDFKGPFIGGITQTQRQAENIVKRIISEQRGFAIIPKIFPIVNCYEDTHLLAVKEFRKMKDEIKEADGIIHRKN